MRPGFQKGYSGKGSAVPCAALVLAALLLFSGCLAVPEYRSRDSELEICFKTSGAYWMQFALYNNRPLPDFEEAGLLEMFFFKLGRSGLDLSGPLFSPARIFSGLNSLPESGSIRLPVRYGDFVLVLLGKELREPVWSYPYTEPGLLLEIESGANESPKLTFASDRRFLYEQSIDPDFYDSLEISTRVATPEEKDFVLNARTWMDIGTGNAERAFGLETRPGCPGDSEVLSVFGN